MSRATILDAVVPIHGAHNGLVDAYEADSAARKRAHLVATKEALRKALRLVDGQLRALGAPQRGRRGT